MPHGDSTAQSEASYTLNAWMIIWGTLRHLMWLYWNCSCEAARGSPVTSTTGCSSIGEWITACRWFHQAISGWVCLSRRIRVISRVNAAGSSTSAVASASGLSRTMAMSISPPSLWIIVCRPAWIPARIATALFSHKVRSHSSRALCASVRLRWGFQGSRCP